MPEEGILEESCEIMNSTSFDRGPSVEPRAKLWQKNASGRHLHVTFGVAEAPWIRGTDGEPAAEVKAWLGLA